MINAGATRLGTSSGVKLMECDCCSEEEHECHCHDGECNCGDDCRCKEEK